MIPDVEILQQSVTFTYSGKTAKNRFLKSAMSERLATFSPYRSARRGRPTEELIRLYETWSAGELGIIITGNIQIKKDHLEATGNAIIDWDLPSDYTEDFAQLARAAKKHGSFVLGQLSHPGRQVAVTIQPEPESASAIEQPPAGGVVFARPKALTRDEIREIVERFAYAAVVLRQAGFDGIQLHAAHGYLLTQFLSPRINKRMDEYGGSLANRSRLLLEIIDAIKLAVKDPTFLISVKLNCCDFTNDGFNIEDSAETAQRLEQAGVDLIELSGGTYEPIFQPSWNQTPSPGAQAPSPSAQMPYFLNFAEQLRPYLHNTKIALTGGFRAVDIMAQSVRSGSIDLVGLARPLAAQPFLIKEILSGETTQARGDRLPQNQLLKIAVAASQLAQIGNGEDITDYYNPQNVSRFLTRMRMEAPGATAEILHTVEPSDTPIRRRVTN